jgi:hypothetical protein
VTPGTGSQSEPDRTAYLSAWLVHRFVVGALGLAMPVILILGERALFSRDVITFPRASLSAYAYSGLAPVFVGTLAVVGVFLITFKILHAEVDNLISAAAGLGALGVALFPTGPERGEVAAPIARLLGVHTCQVVHSVSAVVFIGALAIMSARFAQHARRSAWIHWACSFLMVASAVAALVHGARGVHYVGSWSGLLVVELTCTLAFGTSWLVRGLELRAELLPRSGGRR